jgi:hypothetical protein
MKVCNILRPSCRYAVFYDRHAGMQYHCKLDRCTCQGANMCWLTKHTLLDISDSLLENIINVSIVHESRLYDNTKVQVQDMFLINICKQHLVQYLYPICVIFQNRVSIVK